MAHRTSAVIVLAAALLCTVFPAAQAYTPDPILPFVVLCRPNATEEYDMLKRAYDGGCDINEYKRCFYGCYICDYGWCGAIKCLSFCGADQGGSCASKWEEWCKAVTPPDDDPSFDKVGGREKHCASITCDGATGLGARVALALVGLSVLFHFSRA